MSAPGNRAAAGARLGGVVGQSFCLLAPGPPPARGAPATTGGPRGVLVALLLSTPAHVISCYTITTVFILNSTLTVCFCFYVFHSAQPAVSAAFGGRAAAGARGGSGGVTPSLLLPPGGGAAAARGSGLSPLCCWCACWCIRGRRVRPLYSTWLWSWAAAFGSAGAGYLAPALSVAVAGAPVAGSGGAGSAPSLPPPRGGAAAVGSGGAGYVA